MKNGIYKMGPYEQRDERFIFPFLTGALVGGAAVGLTRPRPLYPASYSYYSYGGYGPSFYGY